MKNSETIIKIGLALLLFLCLLDMPYGFYQFVRFVALIGFGILAYNTNQQDKNTEMIIYGGLALLFQPFFKIALGREMWNIVDVIVGIGLIASLFMNRTKGAVSRYVTEVTNLNPKIKQDKDLLEKLDKLETEIELLKSKM